MTNDCKPVKDAPVNVDHDAREPGEMTAGPQNGARDDAFWRTKRLDQLDPAEWEALCDGCGLCCLVKLEDEDTGEIHMTDVACRLMDGSTCRCMDYDNRFARVSDCLKIDLQTLANLTWLPPTCAYRLVGEGKDLYWWHHLVSGSPDTVHEAGISIRHKTVSEDEVDEADLPDRICDWSGEE